MIVLLRKLRQKRIKKESQKPVTVLQISFLYFTSTGSENM